MRKEKPGCALSRNLIFCGASDMGSNKEAEGQQKNDGQTPEPTNRNHMVKKMSFHAENPVQRGVQLFDHGGLFLMDSTESMMES